MATKSRFKDVPHYARIAIRKSDGAAAVSVNGASTGIIYNNRTEAEKSLDKGFVLIQVDLKPKKLGKPDPDIEKVYCYQRVVRTEIKDFEGK
jgi:hypothetical protein